MEPREIKKIVLGKKTFGGNGVNLVQVFEPDNAGFDPFLMLHCLDSHNPKDYLLGFPESPYRGVETLSYILKGTLEYKDTLGNAGALHKCEGRWVTAGRGLLQSEMPQLSDHLLGIRLWLNLAAKNKMAEPKSYGIGGETIGYFENADAAVRVIAGEYHSAKGFRPPNIQATIYDVVLKAAKSITIETPKTQTVFLYFLKGSGVINGQIIEENAAVLFHKGDYISVSSLGGKPARFMYFAARPLGQPVAHSGSIVMNTPEELSAAFKELREGSFGK